MKIVWLINLYPPYIMGGNEMIADEVIRKLRSKGHCIYVFTGRNTRLPKDGYYVETFNLDLDRMEERFYGSRKPSLGESLQWHVFDRKTYLTTKKALRQIQPDLVIVDNFSLVSAAPLLAALDSDAPVVIRVLDKWLIYGLKVPGQGLGHCPRVHRPIVTLAQRLLQPLFDYKARNVPIIVNSNFIKEAYQAAGFKGEQLHVVHLGIDIEMFQPHPRQEELGRPVRLMFAGMLWQGKGPQVAIQALAELKKIMPNTSFTLDIYGKGSPQFCNHLEKIAAKVEVNDVLQYHGFVSQKELAQAFYTHDIFLFTSIWDEPFSITLLQAMSSGIPVISTTVGGNPEAIEHKKTGLLVPPNDPVALAQAITNLVQDDGLRCALGEQASSAVREKWSFEHYVDVLEELYQILAQQARPDPVSAGLS